MSVEICVFMPDLINLLDLKREVILFNPGLSGRPGPFPGGKDQR
jgi:hypothetical protein